MEKDRLKIRSVGEGRHELLVGEDLDRVVDDEVLSIRGAHPILYKIGEMGARIIRGFEKYFAGRNIARGYEDERW